MPTVFLNGVPFSCCPLPARWKPSPAVIAAVARANRRSTTPNQGDLMPTMTTDADYTATQERHARERADARYAELRQDARGADTLAAAFYRDEVVPLFTAAERAEAARLAGGAKGGEY